MDLLIYGIGFFIVLGGFYLWNREINRSNMTSWDKEKQTVPVGAAIIISMFSWMSIGLALMFVVVGLIVYALLESKLAKKVDVFFSGRKRDKVEYNDNDI